jgi:hypothetical protein
LQEPNPNHDITIKMHGGERHGAFFLRKERFNMVDRRPSPAQTSAIAVFGRKECR